MKLWYRQPAEAWEETLPIGNGSLGAMIWGGVDREMFGLNEESIWSGYVKDKNNPGAYPYLEQVRQLIFDGKCLEADRMIYENMMGEFNESYLPLGNLKMEFVYAQQEGAEEQSVSNYVRELNLDDGTVKVSYDRSGYHYEREYFASYPAKAILVRIRGEKSFQMTLTMDSLLQYQCVAEKDSLTFYGKCPEHIDPSYMPTRPESVVWGKRGMDVQADIRVMFCDGNVEGLEDRLVISQAKECVLLISAVKEPCIVPGVTCEDAQASCEKVRNGEEIHARYEGLRVHGEEIRALYEELRTEHIRDYQAIYNKVELYLGEQKALPTDERLAALKAGEKDNGLYALYFQYGRYLLIASSREGSLPPNLQGIWSWELRAPWSSNYTVNINTQMNYWLAQSCNLQECMEPYFRFMERICEEGKKTAGIHYGCRGFVLHHNADYWCNTNPVGLLPGQKTSSAEFVQSAFWPMGGAWMTLELFKAYEYNPDETYLKDIAYPITREAVLFLADWLVEYQGEYVTCPSVSPENSYINANGKRVRSTISSAMDIAIVSEVFDNYIRMCGILKITDELLTEVKEKRKRLSPLQIGSYGQLLEWREEYEEWEPGHRHLSHLCGLFPGELLAGDEKLTEACRISLMHRLENGGGHTGWSCAWIINLFTALKDGEKAYEYLRTLLTRSTYPNLWDAHPPFQIDGNFGGTAAIANMLVQDRGGKVEILPALPKQFESGWVKGLCIKGGKTVDIAWSKAGEVKEYRISP